MYTGVDIWILLGMFCALLMGMVGYVPGSVLCWWICTLCCRFFAVLLGMFGLAQAVGMFQVLCCAGGYVHWVDIWILY